MGIAGQSFWWKQQVSDLVRDFSQKNKWKESRKNSDISHAHMHRAADTCIHTSICTPTHIHTSTQVHTYVHIKTHLIVKLLNAGQVNNLL